MEISAETFRKNFQSKTDTELLELASTSSEMSSEAKYLLLLELQGRLAKAKQAAEMIQLSHGWYTVVTPKTGVEFPKFCPRCSKLADSTSLQFVSPEQRKFRFLYWKTTKTVSNVPHCSECAAELKRLRIICSWTWSSVGLLFIAIAIWFQVPKFAIYLGLFIISVPFVYLYDRTSAVRLGHFSEEFTEYRFKSHDYAKAFAMLNNVQTENAETLQDELEEAIAHVSR